MTLVCAIKYAALANTAGITLVHPNNRETYVPYAELYDNGLRALGWLQQHDIKPGSELVIYLEDTAAFLYLFWACILGGIIPVPLSAGIQTEQKRKLFNIWSYLSDPYLVCDEQQTSRLSQMAAEDEGARDRMLQRTLPPFTISSCVTPGEIHPCEPGDLAYIQFSSGSTGQPKGVCLTHHNLLVNIADIITSLGIHEQDSLLSWMPLTHDMGMIGFHLTGVVKNIHAVSIPTSLFIRRPLLWMDKTSSHKASVLYSPNFGLQYLLNGLKIGKAIPGIFHA